MYHGEKGKYLLDNDVVFNKIVVSLSVEKHST